MRFGFSRFLSIPLFMSLMMAPFNGVRAGATDPTFTSSAITPAGTQFIEAPTEEPFNLAGQVSEFDGSGFPLLYSTTQPLTCSAGLNPTTISRTNVRGWESRNVYSTLPGVGDPCPYKILSNVIGDGVFIYWVDNVGLRRLPKDTGLLDTPEVLLPELSGGTHHEMILVGATLYGLSAQEAGAPSSRLWTMQLGDPGSFRTIATDAGMASTLRWDGKMLYAIWGADRQLRSYYPDGGMLVIDYSVTSYSPFGGFTLCVIGGDCTYTEYTYYVTGQFPNIIWSYDANLAAYDDIYTATPQPGKTVQISELEHGNFSSLSGFSLFFFERQQVPGGSTATVYLQRLLPGGTPKTLYAYDGIASNGPSGLQRSGEFLLWKEILNTNPNAYGVVLRLPQDAAALPVVNLRISGYEITQGVQRPGNTVPLIEGRPTFFRLFVASNGANVDNVTARLTGYAGDVELGTILPSPLNMTVRPGYIKTNLQQQFVFELPLSWTAHDDLYLKPYVNPFGFPLEPTFNDNTPAAPLGYGPFAFLQRPNLRLILFQVSFLYGGVLYQANDADAIQSWLNRAYPTGLSSVEVRTYRNDDLGPRVMNYKNYLYCQHLDGTKRGGRDDRDLCAAYHMNGLLREMQFYGSLPSDAYVYASVPMMARGEAFLPWPVASGPDKLSQGWPFEQAGFYAGHEIGHLLGRLHPVKSASVCGHSADDPDFPYDFNWIGDPSHETSAFDSGLGTPKGERHAYNYYQRTEVMGYCNLSSQWLSDYTYRGIYLYALQHPTPAAPLRSPGAPTGDDWLTLAGSIAADGSAASFTSLRRSNSMAHIAPQVPGMYSLRLLDSSRAELANYAFTPMMDAESPAWMNFLEIVPFAAGTRLVQLVATASGNVLAEQPVSANAPVVSGVTLPGASNPLQGTVTLAWSASDPDRDPLSFDVLYSANGGDFKPLAAGVKGSSLQVETSSLSGGDGVFRVIACDGVNTAQAESASQPVAMKEPTVHILSPVDTFHIQYGQALNLVGYAEDPQDGMLADVSNLLWSGPEGFIDVGPEVGMMGMDYMGKVDITLQATNSMGMTATQTVQVVIGDDLEDPPPSLSVSPPAIGYQVANGDSTVQTTEVNLANGGGPGQLNWQASLSLPAGWLHMDVISGTVPYTFTLSADPTGLDVDTIYQTSLTISGSDGKTVQVPVSLQIGAGLVVDGEPSTYTQGKLFLPIIQR